MSIQTIHILGASSLVGRFLLGEMTEVNKLITCVSRKPTNTAQQKNVTWMRYDILSEEPAPGQLQKATHIISLAPIWITARFIQKLLPGHLEKVVALGSTSLFTKAESAGAIDRNTAMALKKGEEELVSLCGGHGVNWTILRPTMIHGARLDKNISAVITFIERFGFFPVVGGGQGKRAPVHARDVAMAALLSMEAPAAAGRAYDIPGGEVLTYRAMVERIFTKMNRTPRIVNIPAWLAKAGVRAVSMAPGYGHLTPELVDRMTMDMAFDNSRAKADFGFNPAPFDPDLEHL